MNQNATLTGRSLPNPAGTIYEVLCVNPACGFMQYFRQGNAICILCSTRFTVTFHKEGKLLHFPVKTPEIQGD